MVKAMVFELSPPYNLSIGTRGDRQSPWRFRNTIATIMTIENVAAGNGMVKEDTYTDSSTG